MNAPLCRCAAALFLLCATPTPMPPPPRVVSTYHAWFAPLRELAPTRHGYGSHPPGMGSNGSAAAAYRTHVPIRRLKLKFKFKFKVVVEFNDLGRCRSAAADSSGRVPVNPYCMHVWRCTAYTATADAGSSSRWRCRSWRSTTNRCLTCSTTQGSQ